MKSHLRVSKVPLGHWDAHRCTSILLASFAFAAFFVANQSAAQTRIDREIAEPAQDAVASAPPASAAPATPAETDIYAPVPNVERASLASPSTQPLFSLAQDGGQSSSSQSSPTSNPAPKAPPVKTKSSHHGLGIALAIVGTAALVSGVALFATEQSIGVCNGSSHGCSEAKDAGLVLMPVGAGVAITGFYLQFHR
ncbi:MAG: hypothetical protein ACLPLZ_05770 [Terracidiphilus sp.]